MSGLFATLSTWTRKWARHLEGINDPQGRHLLSLEQRIQALEAAQCELGRKFTDPTARP